MSKLLSPAKIAGLSLKNRVVMPPMCMYVVDKEDGKVTPFHHAHYGARAIGQVGLIILEATAVEPDGRLTNRDLGIWNDDQIPGLKALVDELHSLGTKVGIQLGHGGRKAQDAKDKIAPSPLAYNDDYGKPREMALEDISRVQRSFIAGAKRAQAAGFDLIELHGAHGYLINQFLEPLTNRRTDKYGASLENRYRFVGEMLPDIRQAFSGSLWIRLSMTAYDESGQQNTIEDWQTLGRWLERDGLDCLDISTGGLLDTRPNIPIYGGYQASYTAKMKEAVSIPVTAVGLLNSPELDEYLLQTDQTDLIEIGRGLIRNPNWPAYAAEVLHDHDFKSYNNSYQRGQVK
ncbi:NADH:flavin oxidoreductase / NADH oxidase family protein [Streptococcus criceti]|uniref:NADPH dehydrogenase n=1 Tax=Streptococcus criceti HS-6 TaxID=873449 RepID=G5JTI9_STRCG|nr:NADPH dehydrogenase [Streptococcus criceti]EHI74019.1 NADPH dehydrogenase [Streptococcus criceti HS-6]SUN37661.1 NADH:flavin oxidoreductase / NADH oxidase family protein [Streptococcus criceti]